MKIIQFFPLSRTVKQGDKTSLAIAIVISAIIPSIFGLLAGILVAVPVFGWIFGVLSVLSGLYLLAGIVLAVFLFCGKQL